MKKFYMLSSFYAIARIVGGVFYREFTKFNRFDGRTTLEFVHTHALILGMFFFLILLLLEKQFKISKHPKCQAFLGFYNIGLLTTIILLVVCDIFQVLNITLSNRANSAISGMLVLDISLWV